MSWWHWVIVLIVLVILFGSKKLPEAARGLGRSLRIFKSEMEEMQNDGKSSSAETPQRELPTATDTDRVDRESSQEKKSA